MAEEESRHLWSTLLDGAVLNDDPMMSDAARSNTDHCYSSAESQKSKPGHKRIQRSSDKSVGCCTLPRYAILNSKDLVLRLIAKPFRRCAWLTKTCAVDRELLGLLLSQFHLGRTFQQHSYS